MPRIAEMLLNAAMVIERSAHLGAGPYERTDQRNGYANGLKERVFHSSLGQLNLRLPQTRECEQPYRPSLLERGSRVDRALKAAIAEMYLQGVSTRRVTTVMEKLCGLEVSSTQVSRLTAELDETFEQWRTRQLAAGHGMPNFDPRPHALLLREAGAYDTGQHGECQGQQPADPAAGCQQQHEICHRHNDQHQDQQYQDIDSRRFPHI